MWATVLLVVFRILQGLAVGGQWGGGILLAAEYATTEKRGFYASLPQLGILVGLFLGNVLFLMQRSKAKNPVSYRREEW
jgi:MFS family permease